MGFAEGSGLLFLAGMANGVRFFAPPYWKIDACAKRARGEIRIMRGDSARPSLKSADNDNHDEIVRTGRLHQR